MGLRGRQAASASGSDGIREEEQADEAAYPKSDGGKGILEWKARLCRNSNSEGVLLRGFMETVFPVQKRAVQCRKKKMMMNVHVHVHGAEEVKKERKKAEETENNRICLDKN